MKRAPAPPHAMDLGLRGRTAAVMAASEGIGRAVADRLAEAGCDLVLCARREAPLFEAAREIEKRSGVRVHAVVADVRELHDLERFFDAVEMEAGRLDILVTNHGGPPHGRLMDLTDDQWQEAFDLIVLSVARSIRLAVPLLEVRGGTVVNVVSTAAKQPIDDLTLSNTLRAAVCGLSKSASLELAPRKIRVNCVLPGMTETARLHALNLARADEAGRSVDEVAAERAQGIPLSRAASPGEIADAVAFLASERAAYVTGQAWAVDGGLLRGTF